MARASVVQVEINGSSCPQLSNSPYPRVVHPEEVDGVGSANIDANMFDSNGVIDVGAHEAEHALISNQAHVCFYWKFN